METPDPSPGARVPRSPRALLAGALALLLGARPDGIAYAPEDGTTLTRRWSEQLTLEVDSLDETLDGNPVDLPFGLIEFEERRSLEVEDAELRSREGRPTELKRSYTASDMALSLELDSQAVGNVVGAAACTESQVHFTYDPEKERWERKRLDGELPPERAERLDPDMDLVRWLPTGELAEDGTWKVDPEAARGLFAAGGDVGFRPTEATIEMSGAPPEILLAGALGSLHQLFGPGCEVSGEIVGSRAADEEQDGVALARLEFELELEAGADLGERFRSFFESATDGSHGLELSVEVEGRVVLLWDLAAGHARSARFAGDVVLTGKVLFPVEREGSEPLAFTGEYELSGTAEVALEID